MVGDVIECPRCKRAIAVPYAFKTLQRADNSHIIPWLREIDDTCKKLEKYVRSFYTVFLIWCWLGFIAMILAGIKFILGNFKTAFGF